MEFYSRKSASPEQSGVNLSKSDTGASEGSTGFRLRLGPRGNYIHIGVDGLYYKKAAGKNNKQSNTASSESTQQQSTEADIVMREIESKDVSNIFDSSSMAILDEINKKYRLFPIWTLGLVVSIFLLSTSLFLLGILLTCFLFIYDYQRRKIVIIYDIDENAQSKIQAFYDSFNEMMNASGQWHIASSGQVQDTKYHAGASTLLNRSRISIGYSVPKHIATNVKVLCIPVGKQKLYFFPDRILIAERKKVGAVSYGDLGLECANTNFVEEDAVPQDAVIVDYTWSYVNKSGGQDKRFKNNKELPIVTYSQLHFRSETGLNEMIQLSRPDLGGNLQHYLNHGDFAYTKLRSDTKNEDILENGG